MTSTPKQPYARPAIVRNLPLEAARGILAASIVDSSSISSIGQQIGHVYEDASSSSSTFNHTWGE